MNPHFRDSVAYWGAGAIVLCASADILAQSPDLSGISASERTMMESACSGARLLRGPADYYACLRAQLEALDRSAGPPNLVGFSAGELTMIESSCSGARLLRGPAAYYTCLRGQSDALNRSAGQPNLEGVSANERTMMESACAGARLLRGPAAYYTCLRAQVEALNSSSRLPDFSDVSAGERSMMESACSGARLLRGPAAYYACLQRQSVALTPRNDTVPVQSTTPTTEALSPPASQTEQALVNRRASPASGEPPRPAIRALPERGMQTDHPRPEPMLPAQPAPAPQPVIVAPIREAANNTGGDALGSFLFVALGVYLAWRWSRNSSSRGTPDDQPGGQHTTGSTGRTDDYTRGARGNSAGDSHQSSRRAAVFDPYQVLGLRRGATRREVRTAYLALIKQYHPDQVAHLGPELGELASRKARDLNRAYEELSGGKQ